MAKDEQINFRINAKEKEEVFAEASEHFKEATGKKPMQSRVIRHAMDQLANTPPELFAIDRPAIKAMDDLSEYSKKYLQQFIDEFHSLTGCSLTLKELEITFAGIGKIGSDAIVQKAIKQMVKQKLYQQLVTEYPDMTITTDNIPEKDLTTLFDIASKMNYIPTVKLGHPPVIYWGTLNLEDGKINVNDEKLEKIKSFYRHFAEGPEELKKLQKVKKLCAALNAIMTDKTVSPEGIYSLVYYDREAGMFAPTGAWVKYNDMPNIIINH